MLRSEIKHFDNPWTELEGKRDCECGHAAEFHRGGYEMGGGRSASYETGELEYHCAVIQDDIDTDAPPMLAHHERIVDTCGWHVYKEKK